MTGGKGPPVTTPGRPGLVRKLSSRRGSLAFDLQQGGQLLESKRVRSSFVGVKQGGSMQVSTETVSVDTLVGDGGDGAELDPAALEELTSLTAMSAATTFAGNFTGDDDEEDGGGNDPADLDDDLEAIWTQVKDFKPGEGGANVKVAIRVRPFNRREKDMNIRTQ